MKKLVLKGCGTALATPFNSDGTVDYEAYGALIRRQVSSGVHFLVPLATTGETPALSREEKLKLLELTAENAEGLPLLVGCGSNSPEGTLANMEMLAPTGFVDAFLVVVPFYNKPTQEGQYRYFKAIAEASPKPVVIYNVPGRTGANMSVDTCVRLAEDCPNIVGIKEASGNYAQVSEIIRRTPDDFAVLSGDDDMTFAMMATGAQGVISVASNIAPTEVAAMAEALLRDDIKAARELHHTLMPLFKACFVESNPIPVKAGLSYLGLCGNTMRLPLVEASEATAKLMGEVIGSLQDR